MGCCSSIARINNPERATEAILAGRQIFGFQGVLEEEDEKTQDKHFMPSLRVRDHESSDSTKPTSKSPPEPEKHEERDIENFSRRTGSSPDIKLQKNRESMYQIKEDDLDYGRVESGETFRNRLQLEESHLRISKEQHREIVQFVEERQCSLQIAITQLFQNLANNIRENEKLPMLIEELKNNGKDIENCLEDLMSYPFPNDKKYFEVLQVQIQVYKAIAFEYNTYCKNLQSYKELREKSLVFLVNYDHNLPNAVVYPMKSFVYREAENPWRLDRQPSDFVYSHARDRQGDESRNNISYLDLDTALKHQNQEYNHHGASLANRVLDKPPKVTPLQSSTSDQVPYRPENALAVYYSILEEVEVLNEGLKNLNEGYRVAQADIQDYKATENRYGSSSSHWQNIREAERMLASNSEDLRREYKKLQRQASKLRTKAMTDPSEIEGFVYSDYTEKLNELEFDLQNRLKEIDKLTAVFSLIFKDFFQQVNNRYLQRPHDQSTYVTYIYNPEQPERAAQRREGYETCSPHDVFVGLQERLVHNGLMVGPGSKQRSAVKVKERESAKEIIDTRMNRSGPKIIIDETLRAYPNTLKGDVQEVMVTDIGLDDISPEESYKGSTKVKTRVDSTTNGGGYSAAKDETQKTRNILSRTELSHEPCSCG